MVKYKYVDVHRVGKDGRRFKWYRKLKSDLPNILANFSLTEYEGLFNTIQRFKNPKYDPKVEEDYICDLYFDLDSDENLNYALSDARKLLDYYSTTFNVETGIRFWFSGNRGFHVTINHELYHAEPSDYLVKIWRIVAQNLANKLSLSTFDHSVYTKRRQWRMVNSKHFKSGLYKIELYPEELMYNVDKIRELAKEPREVVKE